MPVVDDENLFTDTLIVWTLFHGGYKFGVILHGEEMSYQIYIDSQGRALDNAYDGIVKQHESNIEILLQKADDMWNVRG